MPGKLRTRHLLSMDDLSPSEVALVLSEAARMKAAHRAGKDEPLLAGKVLAMIFQKPSTRTRVSFEVAMRHLGGSAIYLSGNDIQLSRGETIADTARVLSRYVDGIMARVFGHADVEELARYSDVPVINGLSDLTHPCQILADLLTMQEKLGKLDGLRVTYVGDGNNVTHSILLGCAKVGAHVSVGSPRGYEPLAKVVSRASEIAKETGGSVRVVNDPVEACRHADVIYTDTWASMGQEKEHDLRVKAFHGYQVNQDLLLVASPKVIVMHCLPAHRGEEISAEVMDGPHSVVWDEAENRLHAQKALLALLIG